MVASMVHLSITLRFFSFTFFPVINLIKFISFYFSYSFVTFFSSYFSFSLTEIDFSVISPFQFLLQLTELTLLHGTQFADNESLKAVVEAWFEGQDGEFFFQGINSLPEKWQETISKNGSDIKILGLFFILSCKTF